MIRRKGAEGDLPVPLAEKIEILVVLAGDQDEATRKKAFQKLQNWSAKELQQLLGDRSTPPPVIDFLASAIVPGRQDLADALARDPGIPSEVLETIKKTPAEVSPTPPAGEAAETSEPFKEGEDGEKKDEKRETLLQRLSAMTPTEKIKTALTGSQEERLVLIRDGNKLISRAVLQSPKLSDAEIENFATMKNVAEEVLRQIAMKRAFIKSYSVAHALVNNPRAPLDVTLPLINRLNDRDLKGLAMNKNVPETLRTMATKLIKQKQEALKPKLPAGKH